MRAMIFLSVFLFHLSASAQPIIPETRVNHAWTDGVYWNAQALPGWGFFVDAQEDSLFGAIYGYDNGDSTFIILQGRAVSEDPLRYGGDVFSVSNGGSSVVDVGDFTWEVGVFEASPSARLTISSNILSRSNLELVRFSYVEDDKVDMVSGADWDIVTRIISSFADSFAITDDRVVEDGITYAIVIDNADEDVGVVGYFPPGEGDVYAMGIQFDEDTMEFFIFYASDTEMFGRGWLLDDGEEPAGDGYYFHGAADTMQAVYQGSPLSGTHSAIRATESSAPGYSHSTKADKHGQAAVYRAELDASRMFSPEVVSSVHGKLSAAYSSRIRNLTE